MAGAGTAGFDLPQTADVRDLACGCDHVCLKAMRSNTRNRPNQYRKRAEEARIRAETATG